MDLWQAYIKESGMDAYGKAMLRLSTGKRWHTSIAMVEERSIDLGLNWAVCQKYSEEKRYITAKMVAYDLFASMYDVDTQYGMVMRLSQGITDQTLKRIGSEISKRGLRNLELRAIGLQGRDPSLDVAVAKLHGRFRANLIELEMFGNLTRHLALDLKTGQSYDLLLENRIYGPADLITKMDAAEFVQKRSDLVFM